VILNRRRRGTRSTRRSGRPVPIPSGSVCTFRDVSRTAKAGRQRAAPTAKAGPRSRRSVEAAGRTTAKKPPQGKRKFPLRKEERPPLRLRGPLLEAGPPRAVAGGWLCGPANPHVVARCNADPLYPGLASGAVTGALTIRMRRHAVKCLGQVTSPLPTSPHFARKIGTFRRVRPMRLANE
jgi:hypothetical protein